MLLVRSSPWYEESGMEGEEEGDLVAEEEGREGWEGEPM